MCNDAFYGLVEDAVRHGMAAYAAEIVLVDAGALGKFRIGDGVVNGESRSNLKVVGSEERDVVVVTLSDGGMSCTFSCGTNICSGNRKKSTRLEQIL